MKSLIVPALVLFVFTASSQRVSKFALIPQPVSLVAGTGQFVLPSKLTIYTDKNQGVFEIASQFSKRISSISKVNFVAGVPKTTPARAISFRLSSDKSIPEEGYRLIVTNSSITLSAATTAGIFYGVQTLIQLLPAAIESPNPVYAKTWSIPAVTIEDYPRFGWRGLMLDVSRHFFTKQEVKDFIDMMAKYKFNLLHWHLSDDQGWRVEIKSLPKLTEVGAWRVSRVGTFGNLTPPLPDEPRDYGGFYTQDDIREIVKYAKSKFIDILQCHRSFRASSSQRHWEQGHHPVSHPNQ